MSSSDIEHINVLASTYLLSKAKKILVVSRFLDPDVSFLIIRCLLTILFFRIGKQESEKLRKTML